MILAYDNVRTRRPHAFEQLVDRCLVRHRPYLRRLRLQLLHREQVDHLAPAPRKIAINPRPFTSMLPKFDAGPSMRNTGRSSNELVCPSRRKDS